MTTLLVLVLVLVLVLSSTACRPRPGPRLAFGPVRRMMVKDRSKLLWSDLMDGLMEGERPGLTHSKSKRKIKVEVRTS